MQRIERRAMTNEAWPRDRLGALIQGKRIIEKALPWRGENIKTVGDCWDESNIDKVEVWLAYKAACELYHWTHGLSEKTKVMLVGDGLGRLDIPDLRGAIDAEEIRLGRAWIQAGPRERLYLRVGYGVRTDVLVIDKDSLKLVSWEWEDDRAD
jgi:hypothetical protein